MMNVFNDIYRQYQQAFALMQINMASISQRMISSAIAMLSIACVSAVILAVLTMTEGMMKTLERSGLDSSLLVMRAGAVSELQSVMFPAEVKILANHPQVEKNADNQAKYAAEMFVSAQARIIDDNGVQSTEKLALRGIGPQTVGFRPNFALIDGENFATGRREVIIGAALARKMPQLKVGSTITLGTSQWLIRGVFADKNSVFESEIWADVAMVQSDYQRGNSIQSLRLALKPGTDIKALNRAFQKDPRLNVRIMLEKDYFASQGENLTRLIRWVGFPVAFIMALGAVIAALNTMYANIASRRTEIATQKAIGFMPMAILSSIVAEAVLIALLGGLLGVIPLYLAFDNLVTSSQNANNLSQMMFNFDVSALLMFKAMSLSLVIGLLGGVFPAIKAMKLPVTLALRAQ